MAELSSAAALVPNSEVVRRKTISDVVRSLAKNGEYELEQINKVLPQKLLGPKVTLLHDPPSRVEGIVSRTGYGGYYLRMMDGRAGITDLLQVALSMTLPNAFRANQDELQRRTDLKEQLVEWYSVELKKINQRVKSGENLWSVLGEYPQLQILLYGKVEYLPGDLTKSADRDKILQRYDATLGYLRFRGETENVGNIAVSLLTGGEKVQVQSVQGEAGTPALSAYSDSDRLIAGEQFLNGLRLQAVLSKAKQNKLSEQEKAVWQNVVETLNPDNLLTQFSDGGLDSAAKTLPYMIPIWSGAMRAGVVLEGGANHLLRYGTGRLIQRNLAEKGAESAVAVGKNWIESQVEKGLVNRLLWRAAPALANAVAFTTTEHLLQGENFFKNPHWVRQVLSAAVGMKTIAKLKPYFPKVTESLLWKKVIVGGQTETVATYIGMCVSKITDPVARKIGEHFLVESNLEAAAMLVLAAAEHQVFDGDATLAFRNLADVVLGLKANVHGLAATGIATTTLSKGLAERPQIAAPARPPNPGSWGDFSGLGGLQPAFSLAYPPPPSDHNNAAIGTPERPILNSDSAGAVNGTTTQQETKVSSTEQIAAEANRFAQAFAARNISGLAEAIRDLLTREVNFPLLNAALRSLFETHPTTGKAIVDSFVEGLEGIRSNHLAEDQLFNHLYVVRVLRFSRAVKLEDAQGSAIRQAILQTFTSLSARSLSLSDENSLQLLETMRFYGFNNGLEISAFERIVDQSFAGRSLRQIREQIERDELLPSVNAAELCRLFERRILGTLDLFAADLTGSQENLTEYRTLAELLKSKGRSIPSSPEITAFLVLADDMLPKIRQASPGTIRVARLFRSAAQTGRLTEIERIFVETGNGQDGGQLISHKAFSLYLSARAGEQPLISRLIRENIASIDHTENPKLGEQSPDRVSLSNTLAILESYENHCARQFAVNPLLTMEVRNLYEVLIAKVAENPASLSVEKLLELSGDCVLFQVAIPAEITAAIDSHIQGKPLEDVLGHFHLLAESRSSAPMASREILARRLQEHLSELIGPKSKSVEVTELIDTMSSLEGGMTPAARETFRRHWTDNPDREINIGASLLRSYQRGQEPVPKSVLDAFSGLQVNARRSRNASDVVDAAGILATVTEGRAVARQLLVTNAKLLDGPGLKKPQSTTLITLRAQLEIRSDVDDAARSAESGRKKDGRPKIQPAGLRSGSTEGLGGNADGVAPGKSRAEESSQRGETPLARGASALPPSFEQTRAAKNIEGLQAIWRECRTKANASDLGKMLSAYADCVYNGRSYEVLTSHTDFLSSLIERQQEVLNGAHRDEMINILKPLTQLNKEFNRVLTEHQEEGAPAVELAKIFRRSLDNLDYNLANHFRNMPADDLVAAASGLSLLRNRPEHSAALIVGRTRKLMTGNGDRRGLNQTQLRDIFFSFRAMRITDQSVTERAEGIVTATPVQGPEQAHLWASALHTWASGAKEFKFPENQKYKLRQLARRMPETEAAAKQQLSEYRDILESLAIKDKQTAVEFFNELKNNDKLRDFGDGSTRTAVSLYHLARVVGFQLPGNFENRVNEKIRLGEAPRAISSDSLVDGRGIDKSYFVDICTKNTVASEYHFKGYFFDYKGRYGNLDLDIEIDSDRYHGLHELTPQGFVRRSATLSELVRDQFIQSFGYPVVRIPVDAVLGQLRMGAHNYEQALRRDLRTIIDNSVENYKRWRESNQTLPQN